MKSRSLGVGLLALAISSVLMAGTASAHGTNTAAEGKEPTTCAVKSLPAFVDQGEFTLEATVGDVIEIECNPFVYAGKTLEITASQLFTRCAGHLKWFDPDPFQETVANHIDVTLDADGNANVAVLAGPGCFPGESLIGAHMLEKPFESFATSFGVLPPGPTPEGLTVKPASQVEDAHSSSVATIFEVEMKGAGEEPVRLGAAELAARCRVAPHIRWIRMDGSKLEGTTEITGVNLDNAGNAFVIVLGTSSCMEGPSMIEADLETSPFTTLTPQTFTVLPPQVTEF
jgi:hypothetical protein